MPVEQMNVEDIQQQYLDAMNSGDAKEVKRLENEIDSYLKGTPPEPIVEDEKVEVPQVTVAEGTEEVTGEVSDGAKDGTTPKVEEQGTVHEFDEDTTKWLNSLDKSIRPHVEAKLKADKKELALEVYQRDQRIRADDGRVAAYQRKDNESQRRLNELQKRAVQLEELLQKATAQPQTATGAAKNGKPDHESYLLDDDPDLKQIAESDPELARVFANRDRAFQEKISKLESIIDSKLSPLIQGREEQEMRSELDKLTQWVPNAQEIFTYKDESGVNVWEDWINGQSPGVQALAMSDKAGDVVRALELYGQDIQRRFGPPQVVETPAVHQQVNPKVQGMAQERERKLSAQPVGSASVRPPQNAKPTMEEIYANPELLEKEQERILQEETKRLASRQ